MFLPLFQTSMVILPLLFSFVLLPLLLFSNEATIYPYSLTLLGLVGLNGKKIKKKRQLDEKTAMPSKLFSDSTRTGTCYEKTRWWFFLSALKVLA